MSGITRSRIIKISLALAGFFIFGSLGAFAQVAPDSAAQQDQHVEIIHTDVFAFSRTDSSGIRRLLGNVHLRQDSTDFFCDSAHHYLDTNFVIAYSRVKILMGDSVTLNADRLTYDGNTKIINLYGHILLTQGKSQLRTDHLIWYRNESYGFYDNGGRLNDAENELTSKIGYYYSDRHYANFKNHVVLINPKYRLVSDTLGYNTETETSTFLAPTTVYDSNNTMYTERGYYDSKLGLALLHQNTRVGDTTFTLFADSIFYNRNREMGRAMGHVIAMQNDTGLVIFGKKAVFHSMTEETVITGDPFAMQYMDDDTLFLFADTLKSTRQGLVSDDPAFTKDRRQRNPDSLPPAPQIIDTLKTGPDSLAMVPVDTGDGQRIFKAYRHVRIFMHEMQGRADSLVYYEQDSLIEFFMDPVIWSDSSQISGDTIEVFMKHKGIDSMAVNKNSFMISQADTTGFDQMKGKRINAKFKNDDIDQMWVNGNSESLYWAADDKKGKGYLGINKVTCTEVYMKFKEAMPQRIVFRGEPVGEFIPLHKALPMTNEMEGFSWRIKEKPVRPDSIIKAIPPLDSLLAIIRSMHPDSLKKHVLPDTLPVAAVLPTEAEGGSDQEETQEDIAAKNDSLGSKFSAKQFALKYFPWKDPTGKWMIRPTEEKEAHVPTTRELKQQAKQDEKDAKAAEKLAVKEKKKAEREKEMKAKKKARKKKHKEKLKQQEASRKLREEKRAPKIAKREARKAAHKVKKVKMPKGQEQESGKAKSGLKGGTPAAQPATAPAGGLKQGK